MFAATVSSSELSSKKIVLSLGIVDSAFTEENYINLEKFIKELFPDHKYLFFRIASTLNIFNLKKLRDEIDSIGPDEEIDLIIINTHGLDSHFKGIGSIDNNSVSYGFQKIIDLIIPKLATQAKLVFNACYAICGDDHQGLMRAEALKDAFRGRIDFIYASTTSETSVIEFFYDLNVTSVNNTNTELFLNYLNYLINRFQEAKLGVLFTSSIVAYSILSTNTSLESKIFLLSILTPLTYYLVKKIKKRIDVLSSAFKVTRGEGDNKGRIFRFDESGVQIEKIDRENKKGLLKSYSLRSCRDLFH